VPLYDVLSEEPETLCGSALSFELFDERRKPGKAKVRAFNPKVENDCSRSSHTIVEIVKEYMPFLVGSVTMALNQLDLTVYAMIHPTFVVKWGKRTASHPGGKAARVCTVYLGVGSRLVVYWL
jgi:glutamate dehydrogenase